CGSAAQETIPVDSAFLALGPGPCPATLWKCDRRGCLRQNRCLLRRPRSRTNLSSSAIHSPHAADVRLKTGSDCFLNVIPRIERICAAAPPKTAPHLRIRTGDSISSGPVALGSAATISGPPPPSRAFHLRGTRRIPTGYRVRLPCASILILRKFFQSSIAREENASSE